MRKGEKGIPISLWRAKNHKQVEVTEHAEENDDMNEFYLAKAFIFSTSQVEDA